MMTTRFGGFGLLLSLLVLMSGCHTANHRTRWETELSVGVKAPEGIDVALNIQVQRLVPTSATKPADPERIVKTKIDVKYAGLAQAASAKR